jgi:nucleotide-binding universal stress UspA family protein
MAFNRFLVATDFSAGSNLALESALGLAHRVGASVHLLHVVEDPVLAMPWSEGRAFDLPRLRDAVVEDAEKRLRTIAAAHQGLAISVEAAVGTAAESIVRSAVEHGADLIVVGTEGRHGVGRAFMGSVAERVVRLANCPVLTVRDQVANPSPHRETSITASV